MMVNGVWMKNETCKRCRFRHPVAITCDYAAKVARDAREANKRNRDEIEPPPLVFHVEHSHLLPPGTYSAKLHAMDHEGTFMVRVTGRVDP